jgi:hypothetical protein
MQGSNPNEIFNNEMEDRSDEELVFIAGKRGIVPSSAAHAELLRRNTEALRVNGKSSDRYADKMMGLTLLVGIIALLQLLYMVISSQTSTMEKGLSVLGIIGILFFAVREISKEYGE